MEIKGRMLGMLKLIYKKTMNEIITEGVTREFETKRGVRQRCPLSAPLFNIFIDDIEDEWEKKNEGGIVLGKKKIFVLKFANDLTLVADYPEGLKEMLKTLEGYVTKHRLEMNVKKKNYDLQKRRMKEKRGLEDIQGDS